MGLVAAALRPGPALVLLALALGAAPACRPPGSLGPRGWGLPVVSEAERARPEHLQRLVSLGPAGAVVEETLRADGAAPKQALLHLDRQGRLQSSAPLSEASAHGPARPVPLTTSEIEAPGGRLSLERRGGRWEVWWRAGDRSVPLPPLPGGADLTLAGLYYSPEAELVAALWRLDSPGGLTQGVRLYDLRRARAMTSMDLGLEHHLAGRFEEATAHFVAAATHDPSWASAPYNLGAAQARLGHRDQALEALELALSLDPWRVPYLADRDPDLAGLRGDPRFQALIRHDPGRSQTKTIPGESAESGARLRSP